MVPRSPCLGALSPAQGLWGPRAAGRATKQACVCGSSSWGSSGAPPPPAVQKGGQSGEEGRQQLAAGPGPTLSLCWEGLLKGCVSVSLFLSLCLSAFFCFSLSVSLSFTVCLSLSLFIVFLSAFVSIIVYVSLFLCLSVECLWEPSLGPQVLGTGTWWDHRLVICALGGGAREAYKGKQS